MFVADGLGIGVGANLGVEPSPGIFSARFAGQRQTPLAEMFVEKCIVEAGEIADPPNAQSFQSLFRDFAHPWNIAHVERGEKLRLLPGDYPEDAMRLGLGGRNFRDQARDTNS